MNTDNKINLRLKPEFTYELVLGVPYANWLHENGMLGTVYTSKGMSPYYFFTDDVEEVYTGRTLDNKQSGVLDLPNDWLHHNAIAVFGTDYGGMTEEEKRKADGVLDYSQWSPPDYQNNFESYNPFEDGDKFIVINNQYNIEKGRMPTRYFDIECLYNMFEMLIDAGYKIVYNRPTNTEFVIDENEERTLKSGLNLRADVDGVGVISDYQLVDYFNDNAVLFRDLLVDQIQYSYNELQLRLFSGASGFIGLVGGAGTLSAFYKKPTIMYATVSRARRPSYWSPDSYYQVLSDNNAYPVIDDRDQQIKRGRHDYTELYSLINQLFTSKKEIKI